MPRNMNAWVEHELQRADDLHVAYGGKIVKELLGELHAFQRIYASSDDMAPVHGLRSLQRMVGLLEQLEAWTRQVRLGNVGTQTRGND